MSSSASLAIVLLEKADVLFKTLERRAGEPESLLGSGEVGEVPGGDPLTLLLFKFCTILVTLPGARGPRAPLGPRIAAD